MNDLGMNDLGMSDVGTSVAIWAEDGSDAAVIAELARHLGRPGGKALALPGGTTPVAILGSDAARALNWSGADIWLTDERDVPADHPASNGAMLKRALAGSGATIHPLSEGAVPPRFTLAWLGVGMDGHIASIFPGMPLSDDAPAGVAQVTPDPLPYEAPFPRQTLTMRALTHADAIILVVRGAAKRDMLKAALAPDSDLPVARLVRAAPCPVTVYWSPS